MSSTISPSSTNSPSSTSSPTSTADHCGQVFDIFQLSATSYGNENFVTTECIANRAKMIPFTIYLLLWSAASIWSLYVFGWEMRKRKNVFDLKRRIYLLTVIACLCETCSIALVMAGVQHWFRYLVYTVALQSVRTVVSWSLTAWFDTSLAIAHNVNDSTVKLFRRTVLTIDIITWLMHITCCVIGPAVAYSYGQYLAVNIFYSIRTCLTSIIGVVVCLLIRSVGSQLHKACSPEDIDMVKPDSHTSALMQRLKFVIKVASQCLPGQILTSFYPIWMVWNLYGTFWFQYTINEFMLLLSVVIMAWLIKENGSSFGISGDTSSTGDTMASHRKSSNGNSTNATLSATGHTATLAKESTGKQPTSSSQTVKQSVVSESSLQTMSLGIAEGFSYTVDDLNKGRSESATDK